MTCGCEICRPSDPDPRSTEAWRHQCEVRHMLSLPTHRARREHLAGVAAKRGQKAAQRLRMDTYKAMAA
jgi:hypothetical protein